VADLKFTTGFELPLIVSDSTRAVWVNDWRQARSGASYLQFRNQVSGTFPRVTTANNLLLASALTTVGDAIKVKARWFVRPMVASSGEVPIFSITKSTWYLVGALTAAGAIKTYNTGNGGAGGAGSTSTVVATLGEWNKIEVEAFAELTTSSLVTQNLSVTLTNASGQSETLTQNITYSFTNAGFADFSLFQTSGAGSFSNQTCWIDVDDFTFWATSQADVAGMGALPTQTHHALAFPTGAGSLQQWTNSWERTLHTQYSGVTIVDGQSTSASGQSSTFTLQTGAELGLSAGSTVGAITLYHTGTRASGSAINGIVDALTAAVTGSVGVTANVSRPWLTSFAGWTRSAFDAIEVGFQTSAAVAHTLNGVHAEVLHNGDTTPPHLLGTGGYQHKYVQYTGNGAYLQAVTGVGFRPQFLLFFAHTGGTSTSHPIAAIDGAPPGTSFVGGNGGIQDEAVATIDADGFSVVKGVANGLNESGVVYTVLCVRDDGNAVGGRRFLTGSVVPTPSGYAHAFPVTGFQADLLMLWPADSTAGQRQLLKTSSMGTTATPMLNAVPATDTIPSLDANGFTTGSGVQAASSTRPSWFVAWKTTDTAMAAAVQHGLVAASAVAQNVTLTGITIFQLWGRAKTPGNQPIWRRSGLHAGANSSQWPSAAANTTPNEFTALSGGAFTITGGALLSGTTDAIWVALAEAAVIAGVPPQYPFTPTLAQVGLVWVEAYLPD
jgi:hypothetical protein